MKFIRLVQYTQKQDLQGLVILCNVLHWVWSGSGGLSQALSGSVRLAWVGVGSHVGAGVERGSDGHW